MNKALVVALLVVPIGAPGATAEAATRTGGCKATGRILAASRYVRVFKRRSGRAPTYACLTGRTRPIALDSPRHGHFASRAIGVTGRILVWPSRERYAGHGTASSYASGIDFSRTTATRLLGPGSFWVRADTTASDAEVLALKVRRSGSFAWVACVPPAVDRTPWRLGCLSTYRTLWVHIAGVRPGMEQIVDQGQIDERTLALRGSTLAWRNEGQRRTRKLP